MNCSGKLCSADFLQFTCAKGQKRLKCLPKVPKFPAKSVKTLCISKTRKLTFTALNPVSGTQLTLQGKGSVKGKRVQSDASGDEDDSSDDDWGAITGERQGSPSKLFRCKDEGLPPDKFGAKVKVESAEGSSGGAGSSKQNYALPHLNTFQNSKNTDAGTEVREDVKKSCPRLCTPPLQTNTLTPPSQTDVPQPWLLHLEQ